VPADSSWYFDHWEGDVTGSDNPKTVIIDAEKDLIAVFKNSVTDIDGNEYKVVRIGDQVWMAENLKTKRFSNGDSITITREVSAFKYVQDDANLFDQFGLLYHEEIGYSNKNICPNEWSIPSIEDYQSLSNLSDYSVNYVTTSENDWATFVNGKDKYGFSAKGSGYSQETVIGYKYKNEVFFLTNTRVSDSYIYTFRLYTSANALYKTTHHYVDNYYISVRCIRY